ncbi:MAG TPA: ATP-binding protein [Tepidisphaeraceae bacterium]|nr:ATP-binding protein [Tepidisphaeraceae bacterium]
MAVLVLVGWTFHIEMLKRLAPGLVAMNPVTAVCFLLLAVSLYCRCHFDRRSARWLAVTFALIATSVGTARLVSYAFGWKIQLDELLFASLLSGPAEPIPNRMAPNTAFNFVSAAIAVLTTHAKPWQRWLRQCLALTSATIALLALIGYAYNVSAFSGVSTFIPMAVHTAVCFLLLSLAIFASTPTEGFTALVMSDNLGGVMARKLLPAVVILPVGLGWLRITGEQLDFYTPHLGMALHVVSNVFLMIILVLWTAWMLYRVDEKRKAAEAQVLAAKDAAEAANRAKSAFLANMSHEIRTPMGAILGYADRMLEPDQQPSDRLDCLNTIRRNGEHLLTLINDILDLSKIEAGEMVLEKIACSPARIISDVVSIMRVKAGEKGLKLEVKVDGAIPDRIFSDPTRLRQIIINLVSNAIKFTEAGWVRVGAKLLDPPDSANPRMRFEVIDSGIGMKAEQMSRLFRPFTQADTSTTRRFGGTGLGLSICKHFAQMLGGELTVDSMLGRGSCFVLTLPTGDLSGVAMIDHCAEAIQSEATAAQSKYRLHGRILFVDDGPENRDLLSYYLEQAGAEVTQAENGVIGVNKALDALAKGAPFDVIFMDMQMPEMDGYSAATKLRGKGYTGPIVALTAHAMATDREKCLMSGCTEYLSKPARKPQLLEMAARFVKHTLAPPSLKSDVDDEAVKAFLSTFVAELPKDVARLISLLEQGNFDQLCETAHRLKGSGGLYGFESISVAASTLEAGLKGQQALESTKTQVDELVGLIRRVEGYSHISEKTASATKS